MNRLLDLRFVIGVFFLVIGILLLIQGFVHTQNGNDINRWCGGIFSVFGIVMIFLSRDKAADDQLLDRPLEDVLENFPEKQ